MHSLMKFCVYMYLDHCKNPIECQGQRSQDKFFRLFSIMRWDTTMIPLIPSAARQDYFGWLLVAFADVIACRGSYYRQI